MIDGITRKQYDKIGNQLQEKAKGIGRCNQCQGALVFYLLELFRPLKTQKLTTSAYLRCEMCGENYPKIIKIV